MNIVRTYLLTAAVLLLTASGVLAQGLPWFSFQGLDGKAFTRDQLRKDQGVLVMLFDPYCDHCDQQAAWIAAAADKFKNVQLIFVTIEPDKQAVAGFQNRHFANKGLNVRMLQDTGFKFETWFGYTDDSINIYCYKPGHQSAKYFGKETPVAELLKYLQ
ncbi:MAG: redoxin domain-containing protein [Bacteroidia bacterium]|nr:redoxin domain-containing protein [Bacteroidia bacterium]